MKSKLTFTKKLAAGLFLTTVTASVIFTTGTIGMAGCGYVALSLGVPNKLENLVKTIETEAI